MNINEEITERHLDAASDLMMAVFEQFKKSDPIEFAAVNEQFQRGALLSLITIVAPRRAIRCLIHLADGSVKELFHRELGEDSTCH